MAGIIGKKIGMTNIFQTNEASIKQIACTLLQVGPCVVTQVKTKDTDGYNALQIAFGEKKEKNTSRAMLNHFKKANTTPKHKLMEFKSFEVGKYQLGDTIKVDDIFNEGDTVNVIGTSKGKGFQGVVKRHGFSGVGGSTHGQHDRQRHPGSVGASSFPSRVFPGLRMAGRTGGRRIKTQNLKVLKVMPEQGLILVSGSVPGANNSYVFIEK
jgi:large subunit ribosomal protein L3